MQRAVRDGMVQTEAYNTARYWPDDSVKTAGLDQGEITEEYFLKGCGTLSIVIVPIPK